MNMRVRLTQIDGALPNLALMKLAHWQHAQLKQIREHAQALRVDISGAKAAGADRKGIERARWHLACAYHELTAAITKREQA